MKAVILAGGYGTRISEESSVRPKPMVEIGDRPILWHIMKIYAAHGINDFVICCGYKGWMIKEYFANYFMKMNDVTFDLEHNKVEVHSTSKEPWRVTLIDTGLETMTAGRLLKVREHLNNETFCVTYGDGVSDVDISKSIAFHREQGGAATMTAVQPPGRFGAFSLSEDDPRVRNFHEKPQGDGAWINGGFFVFEPELFDHIEGDKTVLEHAPLERLAELGKVNAFRHYGFWQPMDTLRDKRVLEDLWSTHQAPWKIW